MPARDRIARLGIVAVLLFGWESIESRPAAAGQVRVDVLANFFTPSSVTLNVGDEVTWVWLGGHHSVTSGVGCDAPIGLFDSGSISTGAFSWRADRPGVVPYYCVPHCSYMLGGLTVLASGAPVADFRITEVQFTAAILDRIEITNLGDAPGDVGRYRLTYSPAGAVELLFNQIPLPAGGSVVVHLNATGEKDAQNVYLPAAPSLPPTGSVALFAPNTVNSDLSDPHQMVDYVEWGSPGQDYESTAVAGALWRAGEAVGPVGAGHSIELCDWAARGASSWAEIAQPTFGSPGRCTTSLESQGWGELKLRYK
jgi:plastocyanin